MKMKRFFLTLTLFVAFVTIAAAESCVNYSIKWNNDLQVYLVDVSHNNCCARIQFWYHYWNGSKWIRVDGAVLAGNTNRNNAAGKEGKIKDFEYKCY